MIWKVFDASRLGEQVPKGFNGVMISLDGQMLSELDWHGVREVAQSYIKKGLKILWDFDFGLFDRLPLSLGNETQFLSLGLAIDHFLSTLWKPFEEETLGVNMYQGGIDFSGDFDACTDYLELLRNRFPEEIPVLVCVDASGVQSASDLAQLLNKERFERVHLAVRGGSLPIQEFAWGKGCGQRGFIARELCEVYARESARTGVLLPPLSEVTSYQSLEGVFRELRFPYRLIPEGSLTTEWDDLDYLVVNSQEVTPSGRRQLQGFCAAGGTIIEAGEPLPG